MTHDELRGYVRRLKEEVGEGAPSRAQWEALLAAVEEAPVNPFLVEPWMPVGTGTIPLTEPQITWHETPYYTLTPGA